MILFEKESASIGMDRTEFYRENYQDALDEIRRLRQEIKELKKENEILSSKLKKESN